MLDIEKLKLSSDKFDACMRKIQKQEERAEKAERERPRKEFFASGKKAGFTEAQVKFMWERLAKEDHAHWDGMVGNA